MENIKQQLSLRFKSIVEAQCKKIKAPIFIVSGLTILISLHTRIILQTPTLLAKTVILIFLITNGFSGSSQH